MNTPNKIAEVLGQAIMLVLKTNIPYVRNVCFQHKQAFLVNIIDQTLTLWPDTN